MTTTLTRPIDSIPAPPELPLLGWRTQAWRVFTDPLQFLTESRARYGNIFALSRSGNPPLFFTGTGQRHTVVVFGAEHNRQLLANPDIFHSGPIIGPLYPQPANHPRRAVVNRLGTGLFGINGPEHRRQRRLVMPAFHKQRLAEYYDGMVATTTALLDTWQFGQRRDIWNDMMELTLQIAVQSLFGLKLSSEAQQFGHLARQWMELVVEPTVVGLPLDIPGAPFHRFITLSNQFEIVIRDLINRRRAAGNDAGDVISLMLHARDDDGQPGFTNDEIVGQTTIFFLAGHETSSNALAWAFFLLSQHPEALAALRTELDSALNGLPPTYEQLKQLPFLDAVLKESMRLMPPVPMSARIVAEPVELGGYHLPPGTEVAFSHFHTHHDPTIYPNPNRFDPWRWQHINPSAHEYLPFSAGIRACIGMPFALMELPLILAMTLQRYHLELAANARISPRVGITMSPKHGLPMWVRPPGADPAAGVGAFRGNIRDFIDLPRR